MDCGSSLPLSHGTRVTSQSALTKIDVIAIAAILTILVFLVGPAFRWSRAKSAKNHCVNNLKNIGLAFRIYSTDASPDFAALRLLNAGVPKESIDAVQIFKLHSNEFSRTKLLICPKDSRRRSARDFQSLGKENVSYFASLSIEEHFPQDFLGGDRNLQRSGDLVSDLLPLTTNVASQISWSKGQHNEMGNIVMGDGSVLQFSSARLQQAIAKQDLATNYISVP